MDVIRESLGFDVPQVMNLPSDSWWIKLVEVRRTRSIVKKLRDCRHTAVLAQQPAPLSTASSHSLKSNRSWLLCNKFSRLKTHAKTFISGFAGYPRTLISTCFFVPI